MSLLSERDRTLITMRFVDELKPQEIAALLGQAPNTISVQLHRALKELNQYLKKP